MLSRLLVPLIILLSIILIVPPTSAQTKGWSQPFEVSPPIPPPNPANTTEDAIRKYPSSWFPDLAAGPDGSIHIVWYSGISRGREANDNVDLLMYRELVNNTWSDYNEIISPATGGFTVRNSIAMNRDGNLYVLFRSTTSTKIAYAPWDDAWSARGWSDPKTISADVSYYNALAIDSKGTLHAFWSEASVEDPLKPNEDCVRCAELIYRSSSDGGNFWTPPINLSRSPEGENRPQVTIDSRDRIHAVWDKGIDWYAFQGVAESGVYRRSDDGGKTWSSATFFRLPADVAKTLEPKVDPKATPTPTDQKPPKIFYDAVQQTTLAVTNDGNPVVVYRGIFNDRLYMQSSSDGGDTWSEAAEIPGIRTRNLSDNNLDRYSMVADSRNHFHLLMIGFLPEQNPELDSPALYHIVWDGTNWSKPEPVMDNGLYPEWPRLIITDGNHLHAAWFTRSKENLFASERGGYRVWYSDLILDSPQVKPLPTFTTIPTIVVSATPVLLPTPTRTPLPAHAVNAPAVTGTPEWEAPALRIIFTAFIPIIVLIGVVALIRYWRSRR